MSAIAGTPLIFIDVDGPLLPFGAGPDGRPVPRAGSGTASAGRTNSGTASAGRTGSGTASAGRTGGGNPLLDRLDAAHGPRLLALGCRLVWATTWMTTANEVISPRLGLPELPVVDFSGSGYRPHDGLHWKTEALITWAAGRPFVWIDDEITDADRRWVAARHPDRALLHRVEPSAGLTDADFAAVSAWLSAGPVSGR